MSGRPAGWTARRRIELTEKAATLDQEFAAWRARAEHDPTFKGHHSQILTMTSQLENVVARLKAKIEGGALEAAHGNIDRAILDVHRIWDFFRRKLLLRDADWFRPFLEAADQIAWECWQRVRGGAEKRGVLTPQKTPPLVFLNGAQAPFMMSREATYQPEAVPGSPVSHADLVAILRSLPVPVIGLPWSAVKHVPDALAVAHEVGHVVEEDFRLGPALRQLVSRTVTDSARREPWTRWSGEVFADVFGVVATGPAYVNLLGDALAADRDAIATERRDASDWTDYPTPWLRMKCACTALKAVAPGDRAGQPWFAAYTGHAMTSFESDAEAIAEAIAEEHFQALGGATLIEVVAAPVKAAEGACDDILHERAFRSDDARAIVAGAALAFARDPDGYESKHGHERSVTHIEDRWKESATIRRASIAAAVPASGDDLFARLTAGWTA